jgi:predicted ATP-binding protein involved in virulence
MHFHLYCLPKGEKNKKGSLKSPFLAINAKGGESISPKQKDRTITNFKNFKNFSNWYLNVFQMVFTKIGKTLLNIKKRISFRGSFV